MQQVYVGNADYVARFAYLCIASIMSNNLIYPIERYFFFFIFNVDIIFILFDLLNVRLLIINKCVKRDAKLYSKANKRA